MSRLFFLFVFVAHVSAYKHPKFRRVEDSDVIKKVVCSPEFDDERNGVIDRSRCGAPKEVFEELKLEYSYLQVSPSHVWVKRCVGLCDFDIPGSKCVAIKSIKRTFPVRIHNLKTRQEACAMFTVEEHESCGCCDSSAQDCNAPRRFNLRKCACQCPNVEERRRCLKQRNQRMRWNRSKCVCEKRKSAR